MSLSLSSKPSKLRPLVRPTSRRPPSNPVQGLLFSLPELCESNSFESELLVFPPFLPLEAVCPAEPIIAVLFFKLLAEMTAALPLNISLCLIRGCGGVCGTPPAAEVFFELLLAVAKILALF